MCFQNRTQSRYQELIIQNPEQIACQYVVVTQIERTYNIGLESITRIPNLHNPSIMSHPAPYEDQLFLTIVSLVKENSVSGEVALGNFGRGVIEGIWG